MTSIVKRPKGKHVVSNPHNADMDYNPWHDARDNFADYLIDRSRQLPAGLRGCVKGKIIYLCKSLDAATRRCTLAHELWHIRRGTNHAVYLNNFAEEMTIDRLTARQLIHIDRFISAIPWGDRSASPSTATDLGVDQHTLRVWVHDLTRDECSYIETRLKERDHP